MELETQWCARESDIVINVNAIISDVKTQLLKLYVSYYSQYGHIVPQVATEG